MAKAQQAGPMPSTDLSQVPTDQLLAMAQNHPEAQNRGGFMATLAADIKDIPHELGMAGRYAIEGPANAIGVVTDPFGQFLPGYRKTGEAASALADKLGLPKP